MASLNFKSIFSNRSNYLSLKVVTIFIILLTLISITGCELKGGNDPNSTFKIDELDLSQFADSDGFPEMAAGVLVGSDIYIALQRLDGYDANNTSQIVVFDSTDYSHKATIDLTLRNPLNIVYYDGYIYAACVGNWSDGFYGIEKIDISDNSTSVIFSNSVVTDVEIVSSTKGYFIEYIGWGDTGLRSFNPDTRVITAGNAAAIGDSADWNLGDIECDGSARLWVGDSSVNNSGVYVINTSNDTIAEGPISTNLNPRNITFCSSTVIVSTSASDYSSGAHSIIPLEQPRTPENDLFPTISDIAVTSYNNNFFRIERYARDTIAKFNAASPSSVIWQYSTMDDNDISEGISSSNPYDLIFISDTEAVLLRYGSKRAWIVNPQFGE